MPGFVQEAGYFFAPGATREGDPSDSGYDPLDVLDMLS
jgi:hypothetical protein